MAVAVVFDLPGTRKEQYDEVDRKLSEQGLDRPEQRLYHVAGPKDEGGWFILDVWESKDAARKFSATLLPLIEEAGILPPMPPSIFEVDNLIEGTTRRRPPAE